MLDRLPALLGHPIETIALISIAMTIGGTVKGIAGIGLPIVTLSIIVTFNMLPPKDSIAMLVVPILITNLWQALRAGNILEPIRWMWPMLTAFLLCLFLGSQLLANLDTQGLFAALGVVVVIFSASTLWMPERPVPGPVTRAWLAPLTGAVGGLLGGITTVWGPVLMMYLVTLRLTKDEWVRTVSLIWFSGALPLTAFYWANGVLNPSNVNLSIYACLPGMAGLFIGEIIRKFINEDMFRKAMLIYLFLIGLNFIRRATF